MLKKANKIHSFSEFEKYDLIVLWGAEEVLYDSTHVDYFNNTKRTSALKRIATDMTKKIKEYDEESEVEITVADVKQCMKSLRTQFNKEKRRIDAAEPETVAGADEGRKKVGNVWKYYEDLFFKWSYYTHRFCEVHYLMRE